MTMIDLEEIKFKLGSEVFTCVSLGSKKSKKWREALRAQASIIFDLANGDKDLLDSLDLGNLRDLKNVNVTGLLPILASAFEKLNVALDNAPELVASYNPATITQEHVDNATNAQILYALIEMARLELASPFVRIFQNGRGAEPTSMNSPLPNGESVQKS